MGGFQVLFNLNCLPSYICGLFAGRLGARSVEAKTLGTSKEKKTLSDSAGEKEMGFRVTSGSNWFLDSALKRQVLDFHVNDFLMCFTFP